MTSPDDALAQCAVCLKAVFPLRQRSDAVTCSNRCRQKLYRRRHPEAQATPPVTGSSRNVSVNPKGPRIVGPVERPMPAAVKFRDAPAAQTTARHLVARRRVEPDEREMEIREMRRREMVQYVLSGAGRRPFIW